MWVPTHAGANTCVHRLATAILIAPYSATAVAPLEAGSALCLLSAPVAVAAALLVDPRPSRRRIRCTNSRDFGGLGTLSHRPPQGTPQTQQVMLIVSSNCSAEWT
jgi:hypothetical protein